MINNITTTINRNKPYLDLRTYTPGHIHEGIKLCKIPYKKLILSLVIIGITLCLITPFTNILIPFLIMGLRKFG